AFYKRSWRANDWLWGRLDASGWLIQLLLNPDRLRAQRAANPPGFLAQRIHDIAVAGPYADWLEQRYRADLLAGELAGAAGAVALPECSLAIARRLQLEILADDLPTVAAAVSYDAKRGARGPIGDAFTAAWEAAGGRPDGLVAALQACAFGGEEFDAGEKLLRVDATNAVGTTLSAIVGDSSGLPGVIRGLPPLHWARRLAIVLWRVAK